MTRRHAVEKEQRPFGVDPRLCEYLRLGEGTAAGYIDRGWDTVFAAADLWRLDSALVHNVLSKSLSPPIPTIVLPDGRMTVSAALAQRVAAHRERRAVLGHRLDELVAALNTHGIVPLLIKGSRSIWTGAPNWRALRDLDLLVPGRDGVKAQAIAIELGYASDGGPERFGTWHHRPNLYRQDLPGWIEIHNRGGVPRAEQFIPTAELFASAHEVSSPKGNVRLLPPHLHILHGLVHHHVGHDAGKRGEIDLKGLYEFAAEVALLDPTELGLLNDRAARHPRLAAIVDMWVAGSADLFGLTVASPLSLKEDAVAWWQNVRGRTDSATPIPSNSAARREEFAAACAPGRLRRAQHGRHAAARLAWRAIIALSFVQRPALLPAGV